MVVEVVRRKRKLNYSPQKALEAFHASRAFIRVLSVGRQFGKTYAVAGEVAKLGVQKRRRIWIVGPVLDQGKQCWRYLKLIIPNDAIKIIREAPYPYMKLWNGSEIEVRSGLKPDNLRGPALDVLALDEAAVSRSRKLWDTVSSSIREDGLAILTSTPMGRNWFYRDFWKNAEKGDPDYEGWRYRSVDSEHFTQERWEREKRLKPDAVFRQEHGAEFIDDAESVITEDTIERCRVKEMPRSLRHVLGADIGQEQDFTVVCTLGKLVPETGKTRYAKAVQPKRRQRWGVGRVERFNRIPYPAIEERIARVLREVPGRMTMDSTGVGKPVYDSLAIRFPGRVWPFVFTPKSKRDLVSGLVASLERGEVCWRPGNETLEEELRALEFKRSASGELSYGAASGEHDDCVMALALAVFSARTRVTVEAI